MQNRQVKTVKLIAATSIILLISINRLLAQDIKHKHDHDKHLHKHSHPANEIGIGNYLNYLGGEKEFAFGLHLHYLRKIKNSRLGFGFGYEHIFDEHKHRTAGIIATYNPIPHLVLAISPGILFPDSEHTYGRFVVHSEAVFEFEIGKFHFGPAIEVATTFEEVHIGTGLHLAYAF